jgi:hypothetical protein
MHLRRPFHQIDQFRAVDGLGEITESAALHRLDDGFQSRPAGHEHHGDILIPFANGAQHVQAAHSGHFDITDDDIEGSVLDQSDRLLAVSGGGDGVPGLGKKTPHGARNGGLVVNE